MKIPFIEKLKARYYVNKCFRSDKRRFVRFSRALKYNGKEHIPGLLSMNTHIIEKGLTMPGMRPGFGQEVILRLIALCDDWAKDNDRTYPFYIQAVRTVLEYSQVHDRLKYSFDKPFAAALEAFVDGHRETDASSQLKFNGSDGFFADREASFPAFARSRHSVRSFSDENIPIESLTDAVDLAQSAPSSCNRQTTRVHIITDKNDIGKVLSLQNGNRGFGQLIDKLLVITYHIPHYGSVRERHLGYIDSGIFTMNLLYALHYNRIGACTLNWCDTPKEEKKLRSVLQIDERETITVIIGCGMIPHHEFAVAKSTRLEGKAVTVIH